MTAQNYPSMNVVQMFQARCTNCGYIETEYDDFAAWSELADAISTVTNYRAWLAVYTNIPGGEELSELLCPTCQVCAVCGKTPCYPHDDGEHAVCEDHEGHDFVCVTCRHRHNEGVPCCAIRPPQVADFNPATTLATEGPLTCDCTGPTTRSQP